MARYQTLIPFNKPGDPNILRFTAKIGGGNAAEAKRRCLELFRELGAATGADMPRNIEEKDVYIEEADPRGEEVMETSALEVSPTIFAMYVTGPLDSATALKLDREVYRLQHLGARRLAIDFGKVHPFSSAGLGVLLSLNDRLDVRLVKVPAPARVLLQTLGLDSSLAHYNSFPEALTAPRDTLSLGA